MTKVQLMSTSMTLMTTLPNHLMLTTMCLSLAAYSGLAACPDTSLTIVKYDRHVWRLLIIKLCSPFEESVVVREVGREVGFLSDSFPHWPIRSFYPTFSIFNSKEKVFEHQVGSLLIRTPATQYTQCRLDESQVVSRWQYIFKNMIYKRKLILLTANV